MSESTFSVSSNGNEAELAIEDRHYRVRGLDKNTSFDHLKINLKLTSHGRIHIDLLDLYNARNRAAFLAAGHCITGVAKDALEADFIQLIQKLEKHQEEKIKAKMEPEKREIQMTSEEEQEALSLLKDKNLFERILEDFTAAGVVGENTNKLLGYLISISRKLAKPLSGQIIARSASGKSSLMNAILDFVPPEDKHLVTSLTSQALYYMPEDGLKHKVLAVAEDEGSSNATYPLKLLGSENQLTLAVTVRDPDGGFPQTRLKVVKGPVAQLTTSTKPEIDYELGNRYLILTVDESTEQTRRIHEAQRVGETLEGQLTKSNREKVIQIHHNAQRLLKPLMIHNPFAKKLDFPHDQLRLRRDNPKYLGLIRTIAFLRQYQKKSKRTRYQGEIIEYIEVDKIDIKLANELASYVLGRSLDELMPPTRSFLIALDRMVTDLAKEQKIKKESVRFTRREVRERIKWGVTQVREHLSRLVDLELVETHKLPGSTGRYCYSILYVGSVGAMSGACRPDVRPVTDNVTISFSTLKAA